MYSYIIGKITDINYNNIVIENNKIGYELIVANPYEYVLDEEKKIFVSQQVREDSNILYGFKSSEEKRVFLLLLKVKGVGPKSALAILAGASSEDIIRAIDSSDVEYMTKFPGIGKKSAQQIILDLKGKVDFINDNSNKVGKVGNKLIEDAILALEALGYSKKELSKVEKKLLSHNYEKVDEYVRAGLKIIMTL